MSYRVRAAAGTGFGTPGPARRALRPAATPFRYRTHKSVRGCPRRDYAHVSQLASGPQHSATPPCRIANLTPAVAFLRLRTPARPALTTHRDTVSWFSLTLNRSPRRQISRNEVMLYSIIRRHFAVSSWIIRDANPLAIPFSTTSLTVSADPGNCTTGRCARAAFGLTDGWVRRGNFPAKCGSGSSIGSNPTRAHSFED